MSSRPEMTRLETPHATRRWRPTTRTTSMRSRSTWRCAAACLLACLAIVVSSPTARAVDREEAQFNLVVTLYNAGKWQAALSKIDEREKQKLTDDMKARYLYVRGLAHEQGGQTDAAAKAYGALVASYASAPDAMAARVALIYLEYARGQYKVVLQQAPAVNIDKLAAGERATVALMIAESLRAEGKTKEAAAAYDTALRHGADRDAVAPRLFDLALRSGDHARVLAISNQGVKGLDAVLVALARAEAHLALKQWPQADAEAKKAPADHQFGPRAAYVSAQARLAEGKLVEAIAPLQLALAKMKNPDAPPGAALALVECLLAADRKDDAAAALRDATKRINALPAAEKAKLAGSLAMASFKSAAASKDDAAIIAAAAAVRAVAPKDELPGVLMLRLQALDRKNDAAAVIQAMTTDAASLQSSKYDAQATLIHHRALAAKKQDDAAAGVLTDLIRRKPDVAESWTARLLLANAAMAKKEVTVARPLFESIVTSAQSRTTLGDKAVDQAALNAGLLAYQAGDAKAAAAMLAVASAERADKALRFDALMLLGQVHASASDFANAATSWTAALALAPDDQKVDVMDRVARVRLRAGDHVGADAMWTAVAEAKGGLAKVPADVLHAWAGSLYARKSYAEAAERYALLYEQHGKDPARAYECATCLDTAGQTESAATWYEKAAAGRDKLPESYAGAVDALLAHARLRSQSGDFGRDYWLTQLTPTADAGADAGAFDRAAHALLAIIEQPKLAGSLPAALTKSAAAVQPTSPRYYGIHAIRIAALHAMVTSSSDDAASNATQNAAPNAASIAAASKDIASSITPLLAAWVEHEASLPADQFSTTVAPAMLYYFAGESARRSRQFDDALVHYETVLAVYPYNQWVDAASLGAARCYADAGDVATARDRLQQIVNAKDPLPAAERFRKAAAALLESLEKGS